MGLPRKTFFTLISSCFLEKGLDNWSTSSHLDLGRKGPKNRRAFAMLFWAPDLCRDQTSFTWEQTVVLKPLQSGLCNYQPNTISFFPPSLMTPPFMQWPEAEVWEPVLCSSHPSLHLRSPLHAPTHRVPSVLPSNLLWLPPPVQPRYTTSILVPIITCLGCRSGLFTWPLSLVLLSFRLDDLKCTLCQSPASELSVTLHDPQRCLSNIFRHWSLSSSEIPAPKCK